MKKYSFEFTMEETQQIIDALDHQNTLPNQELDFYAANLALANRLERLQG